MNPGNYVHRFSQLSTMPRLPLVTHLCSCHSDLISVNNVVSVPFFFLAVFWGAGCTCSMKTFSGQGSNLSHSNDNAKSLTTRPPGNSLFHVFKRKYHGYSLFPVHPFLSPFPKVTTIIYQVYLLPFHVS